MRIHKQILEYTNKIFEAIKDHPEIMDLTDPTGLFKYDEFAGQLDKVFIMGVALFDAQKKYREN